MERLLLLPLSFSSLAHVRPLRPDYLRAPGTGSVRTHCFEWIFARARYELGRGVGKEREGEVYRYNLCQSLASRANPQTRKPQHRLSFLLQKNPQFWPGFFYFILIKSNIP